VTGFFFGERSAPLYGVYHAPHGRSGRGAALLCPPFGEEAIRAHRSFVILARKLSQAGFSVLRFDYASTGDSAGEAVDISVEQMCNDIRLADEELAALSGAGRRWWIGLRLGALLSSSVEPADGAPIRRVLWNPVFSGSDWLMEAGSRHAKAGHAIGAGGLTEWPSESLGFPIPATFAEGVSRLDLFGGTRKDASSTTLVVDDRAPESSSCRFVEAADARAWDSDNALNAFFVPVRTVDAICAAVSGA
jgi:alpha-beta hydrolase superfamily lysophospholipase